MPLCAPFDRESEGSCFVFNAGKLNALLAAQLGFFRVRSWVTLFPPPISRFLHCLMHPFKHFSGTCDFYSNHLKIIFNTYMHTYHIHTTCIQHILATYEPYVCIYTYIKHISHAYCTYCTHNTCKHNIHAT